MVELKLEEVTEIDFTGNGYCTDSVIKVIRDHRKVRVVILVFCDQASYIANVEVP